MMKKTAIILFIFFLPLLVSAQEGGAAESASLPEKVFSARVQKIIKEEKIIKPDGDAVIRQNLELLGLDGGYEGKVIEYLGIGDPESSVTYVYEIGDEVSVMASSDDKGNLRYFVTDYVRTGSLMWLAIAFAAAILVVGRWKGLRSLLSLGATFLVIMGYVLPQIMGGSDPVIVTLIGSLAILLSVIYLTEGFNAGSHVSVLSIFFSLIATIALSWFFVELAHLSGLADEEASFLVGYGGQIVSFKGLLLAGIIIGTLGVLDDVVISQVAAVEEINKASGGQTRKELFSKAMNIGVSHISSMANTLFLAYAGASLPLLILFLSGQSAFSGPFQALNNEALATEVVRTLTGSIGLILAMPISTALAVWHVKRGRQ